jgi:Rod binding domain-containing protein
MDITAASIFPPAPTNAGSNGFAASSFGSGLSAQRSFADTLGAARHAEGLEAREGRSDAARAREAAEKLISTTLVEPVLKQLRESNNAVAPFAPTQGEKQFGALLDHRLAHDIVKSANFPMVDRLARNLLNTAQEQSTNA